MGADAVRRLHDGDPEPSRSGSLVCTLAGPDGQPIGTLTIDLEPGGHAADTEELLELAMRSVLVSERGRREEASGRSIAACGAPLAERVADYERGLIEEALRGTRGNRARAARLLQTTERILGYRIQQYGIDCSRFRKSGE